MRRPWLLVLFGAAAAGGARPVARLRRTLERPAGDGGEHLAASAILDRILSPPEPVAKAGPESTLIDDLLAQARLADEHERAEANSAPFQECEIAVWRGYVTWQFYAESQSPLEAAYSSRYFRARGRGTPEPSAAALRAHAALVEHLTAAGWEPGGRGEHWFSERFRRD